VERSASDFAGGHDGGLLALSAFISVRPRNSSVAGVAPVYDDFRAMYEGGFIGCQEQHSLRYLLRPARSVEQGSAHNRSPRFGIAVQQIFGHRRVDNAGMDGVNANAVLNQIYGAGFSS